MEVLTNYIESVLWAGLIISALLFISGAILMVWDFKRNS